MRARIDDEAKQRSNCCSIRERLQYRMLSVFGLLVTERYPSKHQFQSQKQWSFFKKSCKRW